MACRKAAHVHTAISDLYGSFMLGGPIAPRNLMPVGAI